MKWLLAFAATDDIKITNEYIFAVFLAFQLSFNFCGKQIIAKESYWFSLFDVSWLERKQDDLQLAAILPKRY